MSEDLCTALPCQPLSSRCQILAQTARLPLLWQSEEFPQLIYVAQYFNTVGHPQGMVFRAVNFLPAFYFATSLRLRGALHGRASCR